MSTDILTRILQRDAQPTPRKGRLRTRYEIFNGHGGPTKRRKLYALVKARALVKRARRLGLDVYITRPIRVWIAD